MPTFLLVLLVGVGQRAIHVLATGRSRHVFVQSGAPAVGPNPSGLGCLSPVMLGAMKWPGFLFRRPNESQQAQAERGSRELREEADAAEPAPGTPTTPEADEPSAPQAREPGA